jgi:hypothetical protein
MSESSSREVEPAPLEWRVWVAKRQPGRAAAVVTIILAMAWVGLFLLRSPVLAVAAIGVLLGAVSEFMLPTWYRVSPAGAEARNPLFWRRIGWTEVKRIYIGEEVIKLSPLPGGGRREAFRGVLLRCDANQDAVLEAVRQFRHAAAADRTGS